MMLRLFSQSLRKEATLQMCHVTYLGICTSHEHILQKLPSEYVSYVIGLYGPYRALLNGREEFNKCFDGNDLVTLLRSQRRYKELIELYYPEDESTNKDYARKAANRVGLSIPTNDNAQ